MEATMEYSQEEFAREELRKFIEVGLKDFEEGNWLDFLCSIRTRNVKTISKGS